jgi:hypothetical protein
VTRVISKDLHKEKSMEYTYAPIEPIEPMASTQPAPSEAVAPAATRLGGIRRAVITAAVSALLLVGGAVAAVSAASPAPSTAPGVTAPSGGGTAPRGTPHAGGSTANCPNMGGSGGSSGSSGTTPAPTPAT